MMNKDEDIVKAFRMLDGLLPGEILKADQLEVKTDLQLPERYLKCVQFCQRIEWRH